MPGAGTSPRGHAGRPRGRTGPANQDPPAPERRRGRPPGIARPALSDRCRGGAPSRRADPARRPAAAPWSSSRRESRQTFRGNVFVYQAGACVLHARSLAQRLTRRAERPRAWDPLAGRAGTEPDAPRQPPSARVKPVAPAAARVELADEVEKPPGGGVEVGGQLGDLVAETIHLSGTASGGFDHGIEADAKIAVHRRRLH